VEYDARGTEQSSPSFHADFDVKGIITPKLHIMIELDTSSSLIFAAFADLSLETTLDSVHRTSTTTGLACHEKDTVLLCEECIEGSAGFASYVFD